MCTAALLIKCTGAGEAPMSVAPSLFPGDSQVPPRISERSEAPWGLAAPQKASGEGAASERLTSFCLHQPQLVTNNQVWGLGSASVWLGSAPSVSSPANERISALPHNRPGAGGPAGPAGASPVCSRGRRLGALIRQPPNPPGAQLPRTTLRSVFHYPLRPPCSSPQELGTDVPAA